MKKVVFSMQCFGLFPIYGVQDRFINRLKK